MGKRILKLLYKVLNNTVVKVLFYALVIFIIFMIYGVFRDLRNSGAMILGRVWAVLSSEDTLSVLLAGVITIILSKLIKSFDYWLEESLKIEDDHHKIINKYNGHPKTAPKAGENFSDKAGVMMSLEHIGVFGKHDLKNKERDPYSGAYKNTEKELKAFQDGSLYLPSLNVFTNLKGDTSLAFSDKNEGYELSEYIMKNAEHLLAAHKNSTTNNNRTIRLNDFTYDNNTLTLDTMRSTYYHMLMTNRCMDYQISEDITLRKLFEFNNTISPLAESKLSNQIGINGLILSKDGYVLIEKRGHKKTTWKNKFAQSISLALKEPDLKLNEDRIIGGTPEDAEENLGRIITKTIKGNFGLLPEDYTEFTIKTNFLGLARDLLEGGKPNLYFYVTTKYTARELAQRLKDNAGTTDPERALKTDKLDSDYYLVPFRDIKVNFRYVLKLNRKTSYWVHRRVSPRSSRKKCFLDKARRFFAKRFNPTLERECGEALLVTLSYLELCKDRIDAIKNQ